MSYAKSTPDYYSDDTPLWAYEDAPFEECGDFFDRPVNDRSSLSFTSQEQPGDMYTSYRRTPHASAPDYLPYLPPSPEKIRYDAAEPVELPQPRHKRKQQGAGQSTGRMTSNNASGYASTSSIGPYTQSQTGHSFSNYQNQTSSSSRNIQSHPPTNQVPAHMNHPSYMQRHSNAPALPPPPPPAPSAYATSRTPQPVSNALKPGRHSNRAMTPVSHPQRTPEPSLFVETLEQKVDLLSQSQSSSVSSSPARKTPRKRTNEIQSLSTWGISGDLVPGEDDYDRPIAQRRSARRAALNNTYCRGSSSAA